MASRFWTTGKTDREPRGSVTASHYREGNPEKELLSLGEELGAGLIVTGRQIRL